jgi:hypothetical protein
MRTACLSVLQTGAEALSAETLSSALPLQMRLYLQKKLRQQMHI